MRSPGAFALAAIACWASCSGGATPAGPAVTVKPIATSPRSDPAPAAPAAIARVPGVPHLNTIDQIVLSPDGDSAITRDTSGRLRFWASLDGKSEPLPIPIATASHMALARAKAGGGERSWTVALVDTAGGAQVLAARADGSMQRLCDLPPEHHLVDVEVLAGGEGILFLRADRVIELRDTRGAVIARYDRRGFRPSRLRLAGGDRFVALEIDAGKTESSITVYRMRITRGPAKPAIEAIGDGYTVAVTSFAAGNAQAAVSPGAKHFAFLALDPKTRTWRAVVADLDAREHRSIELSLLAGHQIPALGFVGPSRLIARGGANEPSWVIDLAGDGETVRPLAARPDISNGRARAFARDLMVAGLGNWLYVYRTDTRQALYLGYEPFAPMTAAVSPSGRAVAWGNNNDLYITSITGERLGERELLRFQTIRDVAFVDERRILIAYYTAALELYDWKANKVLATAGGGGSFTAGGYDPESRMFYLIPQRGQVWLTEVTRTGLRGPYVVADGAQSAGFLAGGVLWTFGNQSRLRHYTLAEIRAGISSDSVARHGVVLNISPLDVGRDGRIFARHYESGRYYLALFPAPELPEPDPSQAEPVVPRLDLRNKQLAKILVANGITMSEVSPAGQRIAVVSNNVVYVRAGDDLEAVWSYPFPNGVRSLSWNAGGTHLAVATRSAAVVLDAATGKPLRTNCGSRFTASSTTPPNLFPPRLTASVCERPR